MQRRRRNAGLSDEWAIRRRASSGATRARLRSRTLGVCSVFSVGTGLALWALAGSGCDMSRGEAKVASTPTESVKVLVRVGEFERGAIASRLSVAADLEAIREADVFPEVAGVVANVLRQEGEFVREDDVVLELQDSELALVVENKRILHEQAGTKAEQAVLALREGESQLDQSTLRVEEAEADFLRQLQLAVTNDSDLQRVLAAKRSVDEARGALQSELDVLGDPTEGEPVPATRSGSHQPDGVSSPESSTPDSSVPDSVSQRDALVAREAEFKELLSSVLSDDGIVSFGELEAKRYELDRARAELWTNRLQVSKLALEKTLAAQNARLAKVDLDTADLNLKRTRIVAPIDGHLSRLDWKRGEQVSITSLAFHVVDIDALRAILHVPQRELRRLSIDQPVELSSDIYPGEVFRGTVSVIHPVVDQDNGTVRVTVAVEPTDKLRPGMYVSGHIVIETRDEALLVAKRAISYENEEPIVFLVDAGVARRYVVRPGFSDREHVEALGFVGLDGEEAPLPSGRLVLVGHNNLKDGSPVEIESTDEASEADR